MAGGVSDLSPPPTPARRSVRQLHILSQRVISLSMSAAELKDKLAAVGQESVLRFWDSLPQEGKRKLAGQVEALDAALVAQVVRDYVLRKPQIGLPGKIEPVAPYPRRPDAGRAALYRQALERGQALLREGKVAAFLVAGGQGTRLGYDGPKGEFPVTPVKNKPLFQVFAEQLLARGREAGRPIPWYIMTSDVNDGPTRAFFAKHDHFGSKPSLVHFFQQGMMPVFGFDGQMLLGARDSLALGPDGHGGSLRAMRKSGALADMQARGVEHLSYFQVDNPLVQCVDPLFLGLHDLTGSEMSSKTIAKAHALERVGNFCIGDGALQVIEYSDLPKELAMQTGESGRPRFNWASIGIHALRVSFIDKLTAGGQLSLPWHRAEKKISFVDAAGNLVKPEKPNAVKLEQFVFDAIPLARNAIVFETERGEEFSPVKNAEGDDSPATCRRDQLRRAARWLSGAGVAVPMKDGEPEAVIEISPLFAVSSEQLEGRALAVKAIAAGQRVYLE
jgi:UDP-N-acetylglucosamine/UDP-N-acetylgalactosamine diphosphorylase